MIKGYSHKPMGTVVLGTHLGNFSKEDSLKYVEAIKYAVRNGIYSIDGAINYRGMCSERDEGVALAELMNYGIITREEVFISSKAGLLYGDISAKLPPMKYLSEKLENKGYHANSVIGRSGLEQAYEEELRPVDGTRIIIADETGNTIETLAYQPVQNGKDVRVTIDAEVQKTAYDQFAQDPGTAAAMNPKTGEVLALVSTPGYDPNEFVLGMSDARWNALNEDASNPLMNRFVNTWVPGSTFKGITAAVGVDAGIINPDENLGYVGLSWQKDASWGDYHVTTLTDYGETVNLVNAMTYSDNIYFAREALKIGADTMEEKLKSFGFEEELPFDLTMQASTFDDDGKIDSEIQLADTGYGQGQVLVNPLHLLSMYSMFVNDGNMIQPVLKYEENAAAKIWKEQAVSAQTAQTVKQSLLSVIENPSGTGASAKIDGVTMLGKTGTAEIKESQDDTTGVERGWFICETTEDMPNQIAVVGMVEDVKTKGGSSYVTQKVRNIAVSYLQ